MKTYAHIKYAIHIGLNCLFNNSTQDYFTKPEFPPLILKNFEI